ncbi:MAG: MupG family TIM beta-alpha barrel fold protein [Mollicutes bacterium PWAP]|nr:MupG family TIM beta-alpha barrel fold protein [Mollicutes bacterium PWAP]
MKKKKLGISLYPEKVNEKELIVYINDAAKAKFEYGFINFLYMKNNKEGLGKLEKYKRILLHAKNKGIKVFGDVNPEFYEDFGLQLKEFDFFNEMGLYGLRFDEGAAPQVIKELTTKEMHIQINGSNFIDLKTYKDKNVDLAILNACHNFYPLKFTGLNKQKFIEYSNYYNTQKIDVSGFISIDNDGSRIGSWDVNDGMPRIEEHRDMNIFNVLEDCHKYNGINILIISKHRLSVE